MRESGSKRRIGAARVMARGHLGGIGQKGSTSHKKGFQYFNNWSTGMW